MDSSFTLTAIFHKENRILLQRTIKLILKIKPGLLAICFSLKMIPSIMPSLQIYLTALIVDRIISVLNHNYELISVIHLLLVQLGLQLLSYMLNALERLLRKQISIHRNFKVNEIIGLKTSKIPLEYFEQNEYYDKVDKVSNGNRGLEIADSAFELITSCVAFSSFFYILINFHWSILLVMIIIAAPTLFTYFRIGKLSYELVMQQTQDIRKANYLYYLLKAKETSKEVRLYDLQNYFIEKWKKAFWINATDQYKLEKKTSLAMFGNDSLNAITNVIFLIFLLYIASKGLLTLGQYLALSVALNSITASVKMIIINFTRMNENALYTKELFEFIDLQEESASTYADRHNNQLLGKELAVENLSFKYPNKDKLVLKNISFKVHAGEKIAIVGENGAGKSTLVNCILGLYQSIDGRVLYDGVDLKDASPKFVREKTSAVFQDFVKYHLSLRENVGIGDVKTEMDDISVKRALSISGLSKITEQLPYKLNTPLGYSFENSYELSIGQWQRIALARAFFREAELIVLDEPTASMDPLSEAAFFEHFHSVSENKTTFIISHRLGSCRNADKILVLKAGELIEIGKHEELMSLNGEYAKMFYAQSKSYN
ncbi:ABC transporter ATP-binding protein [Paenibacillus elgii]|nr:ABC transporter ATP-binding protein [Paenibacillus elgii]